MGLIIDDIGGLLFLSRITFFLGRLRARQKLFSFPFYLSPSFFITDHYYDEHIDTTVIITITQHTINNNIRSDCMNRGRTSS